MCPGAIRCILWVKNVNAVFGWSYEKAGDLAVVHNLFISWGSGVEAGSWTYDIFYSERATIVEPCYDIHNYLCLAGQWLVEDEG
jgi:hypothetical protein